MFDIKPTNTRSPARRPSTSPSAPCLSTRTHTHTHIHMGQTRTAWGIEMESMKPSGQNTRRAWNYRKWIKKKRDFYSPGRDMLNIMCMCVCVCATAHKFYEHFEIQVKSHIFLARVCCRSFVLFRSHFSWFDWRSVCLMRHIRSPHRAARSLSTLCTFALAIPRCGMRNTWRYSFDYGARIIKRIFGHYFSCDSGTHTRSSIRMEFARTFCGRRLPGARFVCCIRSAGLYRGRFCLTIGFANGHLMDMEVV